MDERKTFPDSVTPLPDEEGLTKQGLMIRAAEPKHRDEVMTLLFSLSIPDTAQVELEQRVAKGEVVPLSELAGKYAANADDVKNLVSWLQKEGFEHVMPSADGTGVYASAKAGQLEKSLAVTMVRVTKDGITYTAAKNAPSLPVNVGKGVHAIIGLQPFRKLHKHNRTCVPKGGNRMSAVTGAAPSPNIQNAPPYLISEILKAYSADGLAVTGKGQTIAILIDTFPLDSDLATFWRNNGIAVNPTRIEKINVKSGPLPVPEGEESLDAEWASGIAPDAVIRIYATGSLQFVDLDRALDRIIADLSSQPGLKQLSVSLGLGETYLGGPRGEVATEHNKFLRLAAAGVNVFVSSGDAGSNPDATGHSSTGPTQAEYASSDPCVIGVGGTSLSLAANGTVASETGWTGSGGGESRFFRRPPWQKGPGIAPGAQRLVPDVSVTADPNEGAFFVLNGQVRQIGGTSWSAPIWAGFCALINEARLKARKPALPFLNTLLYPLMGTACFRDIQKGTNGAYKAGRGYDMVTGIGVPNVKELIRTLT